MNEKIRKVCETIKKLFSGKKFKLIGVVIVIFIIVGLCLLPIVYNSKSTADIVYLSSLLTEESELTTAKLTITGMSEYKDSGVAILNRSDFTMVYKATVWAGINIDEVKISADDLNKKVYISIPKATIREAKVDPATIKYFDQKFALFNVNEKEDANKAQALAEEAAKNEAENTGILNLADKQAETLIKGILINAVPDGYTVERK